MAPVKLFISYSHRDEKYRLSLESHLSILKRQGVISEWHDRKITPGSYWEREIDKNINNADIILLLISSDFISSDYCYEKELDTAINQHETQQSIVIPIIIRPTDWDDTSFSAIQALPKDGVAVSKWSDEDEAWLSVIQGIKSKINELELQKSRPQRSNKFHEFKTLLKKEVLALDKAFHLETDTAYRGIATGLSDLDYHTDGLSRSGLTVIAARPEMGQSILAIQIASHVAINENTPVAIFSLDSSADRVTQRLINSTSNISRSTLERASFSEDDWQKLTMTMNILKDAPIHINDSASLTCEEIKNTCIEIIEKENVKVIVIDGLQRLLFNEIKHSTGNNVSNISKDLSEFSRKEKLSIILTSNLDKELDNRCQKRPFIQDLNSYGTLVDDADTILFLYRDYVYNDLTADKNIAEIIIAKNERLEKTGMVEVYYSPQHCKFANLECPSNQSLPNTHN